jgi:hypothetical protein
MMKAPEVRVSRCSYYGFAARFSQRFFRARAAVSTIFGRRQDQALSLLLLRSSASTVRKFIVALSKVGPAGTEQYAKSPGKSQILDSGYAQAYAPNADASGCDSVPALADADLALIVARWPELSAAVRSTVVAIVRGDAPVSNQDARIGPAT